MCAAVLPRSAVAERLILCAAVSGSNDCPVATAPLLPSVKRLRPPSPSGRCCRLLQSAAATEVRPFPSVVCRRRRRCRLLLGGCVWLFVTRQLSGHVMPLWTAVAGARQLRGR